MSTSQGGIFALGTSSHAYLEFDAAQPVDAPALARAIASLRDARRTRTNVAEQPVRRPRGNAYLAGLISTVLNPKPALFFLSYLPQFINRDHAVVPQVAFLAGIHILVGFVWLSVYASLVSRLKTAITRPRVKAAMERVSGAVLVALGLRVALER